LHIEIERDLERVHQSVPITFARKERGLERRVHQSVPITFARKR
jgi:hypothetical protein